MNFVSISWLLMSYFLTASDGSNYEDQDLDPCKEGDYNYELTECDLQNGRWRVQVPSSGMCADTTPNPATRINNCKITCEAGRYFDLGDLTCRMCRPGTFSLGGGVLFDSWDVLPEGFVTKVEAFHSSFSTFGRFNSDVNCSRYGWQPRGDYLASTGGPCVATLTYTVHLVKPGNLTYVYQYSDRDMVFDFEGQNEQCQNIPHSKEYRWPSTTREGEWKQQTVNLKAGQNILQWKTIGMDVYQGKPVFIKSVEISGVSYTSPCMPCRAGTYSKGGSQSCIECPENHYSPQEAHSCTPCNNVTEYAPKGSATCLTRRLCTHNDYYETRTPCDANNQTQTVYKWLQPKICREDVTEAVSLPPASEKQECPPCNPGMDYNNGSTCEFCPKYTYSDGKTGCKKCPPNTTPNYGYQFHHWSVMPKVMSSACIEMDGSSCSNNNSDMGWQVAGTYIRSGHHHRDGVYLLLNLNVAGFRSLGGISGGRRLEVGRISFTFQLDCKSKCELLFMQGTDSKGVALVQSWQDSQPKQDFSYPIMINDSYTFSWAFQDLQLEQGEREVKMETNVARIYSINVTNTIDGGAAMCLPCHQSESDWRSTPDTSFSYNIRTSIGLIQNPEEEHGCIPCPLGQYIDANTTTCTPCPPDTTVSDPLAYGEESCEPCGPGLTSMDRVRCTTNCVFIINGVEYDLRSLGSYYLVKGNRLFSASGAQYYHLFNISLCGQVPALCTNNVTYQIEGSSSQVNSFVCRTTIVPSQPSEEDLTLSTQSVTLGDELVGVTQDVSFMHMRVIREFVESGYPNDLHFYYLTPLATRSCPQGRTTVITLRCDPDQKGNGTIHLPSDCLDGTCDGCNFNFLWISAVACPICSENNYRIVKSECVHGMQMIHYLPPTSCISPPNMSIQRSVVCTAHIPVELQLVIAVTVALALFLCGLMLYFWKKTQRLEYKYMKLVQSASGRDGEGETELAPAESCALDDGEEEEIQFSQPLTAGILNRIKAMTGKSETGNPFETIQLTK